MFSPDECAQEPRSGASAQLCVRDSYLSVMGTSFQMYSQSTASVNVTHSLLAGRCRRLLLRVRRQLIVRCHARADVGFTLDSEGRMHHQDHKNCPSI